MPDQPFDNPAPTFDPVRDFRVTGDVVCKNTCEITPDNPLLGDGYCEGCHEYPEG